MHRLFPAILFICTAAAITPKTKLTFRPEVGTRLEQHLSTDNQIELKLAGITSRVKTESWFSQKTASVHPSSKEVLMPTHLDSMVVYQSAGNDGPFIHWNSNNKPTDPEAEALRDALQALLYNVITMRFTDRGVLVESIGMEELSKLIDDEQGLPGLSVNPYENYPLLLIPFPARKTRVGNSWQAEIQLSSRGMLMNVNSEYTLLDINRETAHIAIQSTIDIPKTEVDLAPVEWFSLTGTIRGESKVMLRSGITEKASLKQDLNGVLYSPETNIRMTASGTMDLQTTFSSESAK